MTNSPLLRSMLLHETGCFSYVEGLRGQGQGCIRKTLGSVSYRLRARALHSSASVLYTARSI